MEIYYSKKEYNDMKNCFRYALTQFTGSMGEALLTQNDLFLFVDGRYHTQADLETNPQITTVIKLEIGENYLDKIIEIVKEKTNFALISKTVALNTFNLLEKKLAKMEKELSNHEIIPEVKPSVWNRIRPYIYMTAMFAGIWCMMWIFNDLAGVKDNSPINPTIVAGFQNEDNIHEIMLHGDISEYDIYTYEDSVAADEAFMELP